MLRQKILKIHMGECFVSGFALYSCFFCIISLISIHPHPVHLNNSFQKLLMRIISESTANNGMNLSSEVPQRVRILQLINSWCTTLERLTYTMKNAFWIIFGNKLSHAIHWVTSWRYCRIEFSSPSFIFAKH